MIDAVSRTGAQPLTPAPGTALEQGLASGNIVVRLARSAEDVAAAQRLRYQVFYEEMTARPKPEMVACGRDFDAFDEHCEHLLVLDRSGSSGAPLPTGETVVGTYRLLRREQALRCGGFYSAGEFDIAPLLAIRGEILEVGRACVSAAYRDRATMQLLWKGIGAYVIEHDVKLLFGCGSLPGTDPAALARPLSYLHYNHLAPAHVRARALPERYVRTDLLPPREVDAEAAVAELGQRATLSALPPLIKGYLRLGGYIGDGAVIDHEFGTTDVCIIVVTDVMATKYFRHFIRAPV